jgi:hypothetical protein
MNTQGDSTAPGGLRGWWLTPPRPGLQRWIAPWEYRHLRTWAGIRITTGVITTGLGAFVVVETWPGPWAIFGVYLLAAGAANLQFAYWELKIANSAAPALR